MASGLLATPATQFQGNEDEITALTLQLEEINRWPNSIQKGKWREDEQGSDVAVALASFQTDLQNYLRFLKDVVCAHSVARAVDADGGAIAEIIQREAEEERDRRMALLLSGQTSGERQELAPPPPPPYRAVDEHTGDRVGVPGAYADVQGQALGMTPVMEISDDEDDESIAGPSRSYTDRQQRALERMPVKKTSCVACNDDFLEDKTIQLPCDDVYCTNCLKRLFLQAAKDEAYFPPHCCRRELNLDVISREMSTEEIKLFRDAEVEFSTDNRTYCSNIQCGKFVPPEDTAGVDQAVCSVCRTSTCVHCKSESHSGECQEDSATQALLTFAEEMQWQRCHRCGSMVELTHGCHHMTCKCGSEFCYRCGVPWKHCRCTDWDEDRLEQRAAEVVDREAVRPLAHAERQHRVNNMVHELRAQHECNHPGRFERIADRHRFECEICSGRHRKFILRCRRCHMEVCSDCRRTRIR